MANKSGPQPEIMFFPIGKWDLENIPREQMKSKGYVRKDGTVAEYTHSYRCKQCHHQFEINQYR